MANKSNPPFAAAKHEPDAGTPFPVGEPATVGLWRTMADAPINRPIFITGNPETDREGVLSYWHTTRIRPPGSRSWAKTSYWANVLNRRALQFVPKGWRESAGGAALVAALELEKEVA